MAKSVSTSNTKKNCHLMKCFNHYVPLYPGEVSSWNSDVAALAKARKHAKQQEKKSELACTDPAAFKKAAFVYLSSLRCLQAAMIEAQKAQLIRHRLSLHQIIEASKQYKVLVHLDEAVRVSLELKSSGDGFRTIYNFGQVARGAQHMMLELLRIWAPPAAFQYTRLGVHKAISEALRLIKEDGYEYFVEEDIKSHYPSLDGKKLVEVLPLPKAAVMEIGLAVSATLVGGPSCPFPYHSNIFDQTLSGIPQGSAASSAIAEWSVSKLNLIMGKNVALINYADNFFLFAKSEAALAFALEALRSAIAGLPGGSFSSKTKQIATVDQGFFMLGCKIMRTGGEILVEPTETNLQRLLGYFRINRQCVDALLTSAKMPNGFSYRLEGIQEYSRLRNYVNSWTAAYAHCIDTPLIKNDLLWQLDEIRADYAITDKELKMANDPWLEVAYMADSG